MIQRIQLVTRLNFFRYETDADAQFCPEETDISYNECNPRNAGKRKSVYVCSNTNVSETVRNATDFIVTSLLNMFDRLCS
jgi:hypothetical protein